MIPGGDHSSRTLLLRQVSSFSEAASPAQALLLPASNRNTPVHTPRPSSSSYTAVFTEDENASLPSLNASEGLSRPLLPSLEYEESSHDSVSSTAEQQQQHSNLQSQFSTPNWKLWVGFAFLVVTGVGNVIFAKLQALPMYNYPTFLNMYANLLYIFMSFAYVLPVTAFGWFNGTIPLSHLTNMSKMPFFIMGCLDAIGAAMQVLATVYLPGTLLVLLPQAAIPLSMLAGSTILREKYTVNQYLGAVVVFCGLLMVLFPILTHKADADYYCVAKDVENDCVLCQVETTEEDCLSHLKKSDNDPDDHVTFLTYNENNITIHNGNHDHGYYHSESYCTWVSREVSTKHEDWLVFAWSIVMLISCIPSVMSTVYKQVALQAPLDPILVNGWVALFQFLCGLFLVVPSGLVSSPKVHPQELGTNWLNAMECLFTQTNSVHVGCHPDDCLWAALWVHLSLLNSAIYALAMIFVLKYGGCNVMYLGLTLVVPLGHLAFSIHSSFSSTTAYDILGLLVLVIGLFMFRFGYERMGMVGDDLGREINEDLHHHQYQPLEGDEQGQEDERNHNTFNHSINEVSVSTNYATKEGFLEFLREPFMLIGDI